MPLSTGLVDLALVGADTWLQAACMCTETA